MLALLFPKVRDWVHAHPSEVIGTLSAANILLRFFTKEKLGLEIPSMKSLSIFIAYILMASSCQSVPIDPSVNAAEAGARTAIVGGCGSKGNSKYLYCEENQGNSLSEKVTIFVPLVDCNRDSCSRFQFFRKNGSNGPSGAIAKGKVSATITLSDITGHEGNVTAEDDGEYGVLIQTFYLGQDGQEFSMLAKGLVRVSVVSDSYRPMACNDPNTAWSSKIVDKCEAQFTTAYRSVICGSGCK